MSGLQPLTGNNLLPLITHCSRAVGTILQYSIRLIYSGFNMPRIIKLASRNIFGCYGKFLSKKFHLTFSDKFSFNQGLSSLKIIKISSLEPKIAIISHWSLMTSIGINKEICMCCIHYIRWDITGNVNTFNHFSISTWMCVLNLILDIVVGLSITLLRFELCLYVQSHALQYLRHWTEIMRQFTFRLPLSLRYGNLVRIKSRRIDRRGMQHVWKR